MKRWLVAVLVGVVLASGCTLLHALEGASVIVPVGDGGAVVVGVARPDGG